MKTHTKSIVFILLILFSINFAAAALTDGLQHYYSFDTNADDEQGTDDGTVTDATHITTGQACGAGAYNFVKADSEYITYADPLVATGDKTLCQWIKRTTNDGAFEIISNNDFCQSSSMFGTCFYFVGAGWGDITAALGNGAGAGQYLITATAVTDGDWHHYCYTYEESATNLTIYKDGVLKSSDTVVSGSEVGTAENYRIGADANSIGYYFNGDYDEFGIWNRVLSTGEINELYAGGSCHNPLGGGGGGVDPALTFTVNITNSSVYSFVNYSTGIVYFNVTSTITNNSNIYDGNLYYNNTYIKNFSNIDLSTVQYFNFSFIDLEMIWEDVYINFSNANASHKVALNLTMDGIHPTITTTFINMSSHNVTTDNNSDTINFNFTFSDTNLDGVIYEIKNNDLSNQRTYKSIEGITTNTYNINEDVDFANLTTSMNEDTTDTFWINITVFDSHNPLSDEKIVRKLDYYYINDTIIIEKNITLRADSLKLGVNNKGEEYTYFFLDDNKYKFKATFEDQSLSHTFYISKEGLRYIDYSNYKGHFVHTRLKRYIDFEGKNIESVEVVSYFNEYKVKVNLYELSDEIEFESIGDLNIINEIRYFDITLQAQDSLNTEYLSYLPSIDSHLSNIEGFIKMIPITIIILCPMLLGFLLIAGAFVLNPEEHPALRMFLMLFAFMTYFMSAWMGLQTIINYLSFDALQESLSITVWAFGLAMFAIISYFIIYIFYKASAQAAQDKKEMMLQ